MLDDLPNKQESKQTKPSENNNPSLSASQPQSQPQSGSPHPQSQDNQSTAPQVPPRPQTQSPDPQPQEVDSPRTISTPMLGDLFATRSPDPVKIVNIIFHECIKLGASDILFEPSLDRLLIRTRIDGVLYKLGEIGGDIYPRVASRIKVLAQLDPTEHRKIQEGQVNFKYDDKNVNLRVEIAQLIHGEIIVVRIHEKKTIVIDLANLGLSKDAYQKYQDLLKTRSGLVLVCGPTGSGKTTTLYSTIVKLNASGEYNVMTIEDPVEFQLEGANQMQVGDEAGFTFADGLKTTLRLSPDIVLVGEIRDKETAKIAVESGLTGQLVFSTLHSPDSIGALFRLFDLGIETHFLNSTLNGIIAQRLVRKLCDSCKKTKQATQEDTELFEKIIGRAPKQLFSPVGCAECKSIGYKGRLGVFEVLAFDSEIRTMVRNKTNEDKMRKELKESDFVTLMKDGLQKAEQGLTTVSEVLRNSIRTV